MADHPTAVKKSVLHSRENNWPVTIAFPNTEEKLEIQIHVAVDRAIWRVPVISGPPYNPAILHVLYAGLHLLKETPIFPSVALCQQKM